MASSSPFGFLSELMGLKEASERIRTYQTLNRQRDEELADDDAIRKFLQRHTPTATSTPAQAPGLPGPMVTKLGAPGQMTETRQAVTTGEPNYSLAITDLYRAGRGSAALKLQTALIKINQERLSNIKTQNEETNARLAQASRIAQGIDDEQSFARALPQIKSLMGDSVAQMFGTRYDPEVIEQIIAQGRDAQSHLTAARDAFNQAQTALNNTQKIVTDERDWASKSNEIRKEWIGFGSSMLSLANNQEDWDSGVTSILSGTSMLPDNMGQQIVAMFGTEYSPEAKEKARKLGMSQAERSTESRDWSRIDLQRQQAQNLDDELISDEAADMLARNFAFTGNLPAMGMGSNAANNRIRIFNRAAELFQGLDVATQSATFKAYSQSLNNIQKALDAVNAFENTAKGNLEQFVNQASRVIDTGSPLVNNPLRTFSDQVLGSPNMAAYNTARRVVIPEIARLLTSVNMTGVLSDSARSEIEGVLNEDSTLPQVVAAVNVLLNDMDNRKETYEEQVEFMRSRMAASPRSIPGTNVNTVPIGSGTQADPYIGPNPPPTPQIGEYWESPNGMTRWNGQMWAIMQQTGAQ